MCASVLNCSELDLAVVLRFCCLNSSLGFGNFSFDFSSGVVCQELLNIFNYVWTYILGHNIFMLVGATELADYFVIYHRSCQVLPSTLLSASGPSKSVFSGPD